MFEITWFDTDIYKLLLRLSINLLCITTIVRCIYYPNNSKKNYLFTYYAISFITFFLCFSLKKLDIDTGMGLGLFAIFGIIRYRTTTVETKEMTYLFTVIGLSVINSLAANKISMIELCTINCFIVLMFFVFEYIWLPKHETQQTTLVLPNKFQSLHPVELKAYLAEQTGLDIKDVKISKINYANKNIYVEVFYRM